MRAQLPFLSVSASARRWVCVVAILFSASVTSLPARRDSPTISILTRNQFLGADLTPIAQAGDVASFLGDKTPSGLWPSDHAGVFVRLWF